METANACPFMKTHEHIYIQMHMLYLYPFVPWNSMWYCIYGAPIPASQGHSYYMSSGAPWNRFTLLTCIKIQAINLTRKTSLSHEGVASQCLYILSFVLLVSQPLPIRRFKAVYEIVKRSIHPPTHRLVYKNNLNNNELIY